MDYLALNYRCAVNFNELGLPLHENEIAEWLRSLGYTCFKFDAVSLARKYIGKTTYERGASLSQAPLITDCSSLVQYVYRFHGIDLPRITFHQRNWLSPVNSFGESQPGDLLYSTSEKQWGDTRRDQVGHVGILTGEGTIVHSQREHPPGGTIESNYDRFIKQYEFRGIRRVVPDYNNLWTIVSPRDPEKRIGFSQEIKTLYQALHGKAPTLQ